MYDGKLFLALVATLLLFLWLQRNPPRGPDGYA